MERKESSDISLYYSILLIILVFTPKYTYLTYEDAGYASSVSRRGLSWRLVLTYVLVLIELLPDFVSDSFRATLLTKCYGPFEFFAVYFALDTQQTNFGARFAKPRNSNQNQEIFHRGYTW